MRTRTLKAQDYEHKFLRRFLKIFHGKINSISSKNGPLSTRLSLSRYLNLFKKVFSFISEMKSSFSL